MFTILAVLTLIAAAAAFLVIPFRFPTLATRLLEKMEVRLLGGRIQVLFSRPGSKDRERLVRVRAWAALSVLVLFVGSLWFGGVTRNNHPDSIPAVLFWAAFAGIASFLMLAVFSACATYIPRTRGHHALYRQGFQALWNVVSDRAPPGLIDAIGARMKASSCVRILDVTGYELIGKGPDKNGGILYDTLSTMTAVPVQILLLEPEARVLDPDQKHATVYQTILAEMEGTPVTYHRKLKSTLQALQVLNANRPAESRIVARFYQEKPCFREILFDGSVMVLPPFSRENQADLPIIELSKAEGASSSFFEGFRRNFSRLWAASSPEEKAAKILSTRTNSVVRRQGAAEPQHA